MPPHVTQTSSRARTVVRVLITLFMLLLLSIVALGWIWNASHQAAPPLRTASHVVLAIAGSAGILALAKIWRSSARS